MNGGYLQQSQQTTGNDIKKRQILKARLQKMLHNVLYNKKVITTEK